MRNYRDEVPNAEFGTQGTLKDYYYLTLILGFGLLVSIGVFVSVAQLKYSSIKQEFEIEAALTSSGLDLVFSNQLHRIENLESELSHSRFLDGKISPRLRDELNRTDFNRLVFVNLNPANQEIEKVWEYESQPEAVARDFDFRRAKSLRESLSRLNSAKEKFTVAFFMGPRGTEFALVWKYLGANDKFLIAFLDADYFMGREAKLGQYLIIEQAMFGGSEYYLLAQGDGESRPLRPLTSKEIMNLRVRSSFQAEKEIPALGGAIRVQILKHHSLFSDLAWPVGTMLGCLTITGLIAFLVFSLINQNIEVHKQVVQKTRDLEAESRKARDAANAKTRFLANVSHEVRTPLNLILGMADLLRETSLNKEQSRFVDNFSRAGNHLLRLIGDILDVARMDSDGIKIFPDRVQILKFFEELVEFVAPSCLMKNISVNLYVDPQLPREAFFDPGRVKQIVLNLFNNSLKFTDSGAISIEVKYHVDKDGAGKPGICLSVTDTGIGIPSNHIQDIFKEFYQVDASATRSKGGAGLGLSIVRAIVDKLAGTIQVHSEVNVGTNISIYLPMDFSTSQRIADLVSWSGKRPGRVGLLYADEKLCVETFRWISELGIHVESMPLSLANLKLARERLQDCDYIFIELSPETQLNWYRVLKENLPTTTNLVVITRGHIEVGLAKSFAQNWRYAAISIPVLPSQMISAMGGSMRPALNQVVPWIADQVPAAISVPDFFKVLIVEDDYDNRLLIEAYMAKQSFRYEFAVNGKDALAAVAADRPSLIITDLQMPVMDGFTFIEEMRRNDAINVRVPCPIFILTADAQDETVRMAKALGVEKIINKPVRKKDFIAALKECAQSYTEGLPSEPPLPPNHIYLT